MRAALLVLLFCFCCIGSAAEEASLIESETQHVSPTPGTGGLGHLDGVIFKPLFPYNEDLEFVAGEIAEGAVGFVNTLDRFINVTSLDGSLRNLADESVEEQKLPRQQYGINTPGKGTSVVLDYFFKPDPMLDAAQYVLILTASYLDGTANHTEVVFNGTVRITPPDDSYLNTENAFLVLALGSIGAGVAYYVSQWASKKSKRVARGGDTSAKNESFLEGTLAANKKSPKTKKNQ